MSLNPLDYPDDRSYRKALGLSVREFCEQCKCYHPPHACDIYMATGADIVNAQIEYLNNRILVMEEDIRALHRNCDPVDMTYEDHLVWERWNKTFHPENYDQTNVSQGDGAV